MNLTDKNNDNERLSPIERQPISDIKCEEFVLSSMIQHTACVLEVDGILTPDCFYNRLNREVYQAIHDIFARGDNPDFITIPAELAAKGSQYGAMDVIGFLDGASTYLDLSKYAHRLKELAIRRKLYAIGLNLATRANDETNSLDNVHTEAKEGVDKVFDDVQGDKLTTLAEVYTELQQQMLINQSLIDGQVFGTSSGFPDIDKRGGLVGGSLNIIGAETSVGKTSFANALTLAAIRQGHGVAYYSMEMQPKELNARFAAMMTGIPANKILYDRMDMADIYKCDNAMKSIDGTLLHFDGSSTSSLDSILMSIRSMKSKFDIKGAIVDYLQLVSMEDRRLSREQSVGRIARQLKNLAKELDIWVIALSQLARDRDRPVPSMSRLRDSGQIEEAADNVFLLYRILDGKRQYPEPFENAPTNGTAMVIIGKGRNTGIGSFLCAFNPETTHYRPLETNELNTLQTAPPTYTDAFRSPGEAQKPTGQMHEDLPF